jgi:ketosteroid isomerase-like protein
VKRVAHENAENERRWRSGMEAYSRGDYEGALRYFHPEIEWIPDRSVMPDATVYRGHEGVRRFWETWAEVIEGMRLEIESCETTPDGRVLAVTRAVGRGAGSGAAVASRAFAQVAEFEEGMVVRVWLFGDPRRARAASARPQP